MSSTDTLFQRFLVGVFVFFIALGAYSYHDRTRTLECRSQAQTNGATAVDAVALCKK